MKMENRKTPLISVVVPIYKVEKYLVKCVDSIRNQTLKDIEIILVDDGSPDRCGQMCDELAEEDDRITVVHKENGGLSDARNAGIDAAKAKLVAFIDSDDYIDPDMMEFLYNNLVKAGADLSVCGLCHHFGEVIQISEDKLNGYRVADTKEAIRLELTEVPVTAVNKLYKKSLFEHVRFPKGKLYEDAHTMTPVILETSRVVYDIQPKYHYIHREDSITTKNFRMQSLSLIEANENNMKLIVARYPELREPAEFRYFWSFFWILEYILRSSSLDEEAIRKKKEICKLLKKNTWKIVTNSYFTKTRKISALILFFSSTLYEKTAKMYMKHQYANPSAKPE